VVSLLASSISMDVHIENWDVWLNKQDVINEGVAFQKNLGQLSDLHAQIRCTQLQQLSYIISGNI